MCVAGEAGALGVGVIIGDFNILTINVDGPVTLNVSPT